METPSVFSEMWNSYKRTILHSILTSFGLDFIVHDQNGGDVDTIRSVRETGVYKNTRNATAYEKRGDYDSIAYHHNEAYDSTVREARNSNDFFDDAYVPGNRIFYGQASGLGSDRRANLDHVISANEIHNDRGRVLAELDGVDLANRPSNLQFTNEHLNKSMKDMTIDEYIEWRAEKGDPLPDDVVRQMREKDAAARRDIDKTINKAYYTSDKFISDAGKAAAKRGIEMGIRQALGFVFLEIWFACEDEIKELPAGVTFSDCTKAVATGIQKGVDRAKVRYKDILSQFEQGFIAGALASITTTLINIFLTTDKNAVRYIRQVYTIVVQTGNILLINPDDLLLGDQLKAATVSVATGASILAGTAVGNQIAKTPIGQDKNVGNIIIGFSSSLVSGLISCTLLIMIDRSKFMQKLVSRMNEYGSTDHEIRETAKAFIQMAAEIASYDIDEFCENVEKFNETANRMQNANEDELHALLLETFEEYEIPIPWQGDFDSFMNDDTQVLDFD